MHISRTVILCSIILPELSIAWSFPQFDLHFPFYSTPSGTPGSQTVLEPADAEPSPFRVAIIGAGAAGSSAAFWISKAKERHEQNIHVDVYEQSDYIGGRSTVVYPYGNTSLHWVELGATIFVEVNRNMMRAAKEFNLTLIDLANEMDNGMGIWDGTQFVLTVEESGWRSWLGTVKILWRYGYTSLKRASKITSELVDGIKILYTPKLHKWPSVEDLSKQLNWLYLTAQTSSEYMTGQGISERFIHELHEGMTRVNYGQNSDELHGLLGSVSMATDGAVGVEGGSFQVFEQFLNRSGANVHLNTKVTGLRKTTGSSSTKWVLSVAGDSSTPEIPPYDNVIIAAPFASSAITILGSPAAQTLLSPPVKFVHLHVTLLTTTSPAPNASYFGLREGSRIPKVILTTWDAVRHGDDNTPRPEFNALNYVDKIKTLEIDGVDEWVVKIFSSERIPDESLENLFGTGLVGWVFRKEWDAYAHGRPTTEFPPLNPDTGLWYVNSFESCISTMETETLASRNVVDLMFERQFAAGICPPDAELSPTDNDDAKAELKKKDGWGGTGADGRIYGWDC